MDSNDSQSSEFPSFDFMRDVFGHLPLMIVQLNVDGIVISLNPEVTRVTGYRTEDLVGKNWWGMMFPGKLFRQVPKFISAVQPNSVLRDVPMVLRTSDGQERTIAWTRFARELEKGPREVVLIGLDLTDRLNDADRDATAVAPSADAGDVEGVVVPIAASPPRLADDHAHKAIQEVHDFLTQVDARIDALEAALMKGELGHVASIADQLRSGAYACGLLHVSGTANRLFHAAAEGALGDVTRQINELVGLCRQPSKQG